MMAEHAAVFRRVRDEMATTLLELLLGQGDRWLSGEDAARQLGLSRAMVWKQVDRLRERGVTVDAATRKGYRLRDTSRLLTQETLMFALDEENESDTFYLTYYPQVDSTNTQAKLLADDGAPEWTVVVAGEQTAGRGRRGRSFYSPNNTGLYMSVIVRPQVAPTAATLLTIAAAVAVADALEEATSSHTQIKWVNDVYMNDKKVAGILTEAALSVEDDQLRYAVVGMGINIFTRVFPDDVASVAGAVWPVDEAAPPLFMSRLAARILTSFRHHVTSLLARDYLPHYRRRLRYLNEQVRLMSSNSARSVILLGVDDWGRLLVRNELGAEETVVSGEISVRQ